MTRKREMVMKGLCGAVAAVGLGMMLSACGTHESDRGYQGAYVRSGAAQEETGILAASESVGFNAGSFHRPAVAAAKAVKSERLAEDLWIIEAATAGERTPCLGTLVGRKGDEKRDVFLLQGAVVKPTLTGTVATVQITQQFENAAEERVDAEYTLALPADATPSDFLMTIGERKVRAIVRDRASAEKLYIAAKGQGFPVTYAKAGSPLSISVGNIDAGRDVAVSIQYIQQLAVKDGVCTFSLGTKGLAKEKNGPADGVTLDFQVNAGMTIEDVDTPYALHVDGDGRCSYRAKLNLEYPRDYYASFTLAGKEPKATLMSHRDSRGLYYAVNVVAPMDRAVGGLMLASRELGEVRLPEVAKGRAILIVGRVDPGRELRDPPTLTWGDRRASIRLSQQTCAGLPFLWARAQHDGLAGPGDVKARTQIALEHGLLTAETAVLAVDTTRR